MSKKKRALEKQRKQNSLAKKAKQRKKSYYASSAAKERWNDKKGRKENKQLARRESMGISVNCPLQSWEKPDTNKCKECFLKCSYKA